MMSAGQNGRDIYHCLTNQSKEKPENINLALPVHSKHLNYSLSTIELVAALICLTKIDFFSLYLKTIETIHSNSNKLVG